MRIIFDECIPTASIEGFRAFVEVIYADRIFTIEDIHSLQMQGRKDEDWIPQVANTDCIIITGDRSRGGQSKAGRDIGPKFRLVCQRYRITCLELTGPLRQRGRRAVAEALASAAGLILSQITEAPRGSQFVLKLGSPNGYVLQPSPRQESTR